MWPTDLIVGAFVRLIDGYIADEEIGLITKIIVITTCHKLKELTPRHTVHPSWGPAIDACQEEEKSSVVFALVCSG